MKTKDRIGGIIFAIFGVMITVMATGINMPANLSEPGPRLFPYIAGIGMAICGAGMALTAKNEENGQPYLTKDGWKRLGVAALVMVLYYFALEYIGFIIATPIFTFAIITILSSGKKLNKIVTAIVALITTGALYAAFQIAFQLLLPRGKFF